MTYKDLPLNPTDKMLRQFAGLCLVIFGLLAAWQAWRGNTLWAVIFGVLALLGPVGLASPRAIKPIFIAWMVLVFPIGWLVSKLMLGLLFYVLFTPIAAVFRLTGRDALDLKPRADRSTYFVPKPKRTDLRSYFRQF